MSNRNLSKAIQGLSQEISKLCRSMTKQVINWLLRAAFVIHRPGSSSSGFVLPTTVLLILVVSLSVGALTYRAFTRNTQVITQNQQRIISNAATPAIDRARSKLEFMFDPSKDPRYPSGGVPAETKLLSMMLNNGTDAYKLPGAPAGKDSPYDLPDETRVDLDNSVRTVDNAWSYETEDSTIVYSIIFQTPAPVGTAKTDFNDLQKILVSKTDKEKAELQVVRHGPLTTETGGACKVTNKSGSSNARDLGWFEDPSNTSIVRKNFQVDVLVIPHKPNSTAVTLEFQQDRQISKGNKWAAWFRNDLEVYPGPEFRWNGAMHTEGSLIVGGNKFKAFLISSTESCLYPPIENSEITVTSVKAPDAEGDFLGTLAIGKIGMAETKGKFALHFQNGGSYGEQEINEGSSGSKAADLKSVYSDPEVILTQDKRQTKEPTAGASGEYTNRNNDNWKGLPATVTTTNRRLRQNAEPSPYIDDLYRADDRWGPKPKYSNKPEGKVPERSDASRTGFGYPIPNTTATKALTAQENTLGSERKKIDKTDEEVGFDGYWERRARNEGLRVIVGERLEMGNLFGWTAPQDTNGDKYINPNTEIEGDPLYPPEVAPYPVRSNAQFLTHLNQQRRTLRDNLSAVQATAIYHTDLTKTLTKDYPVACLASTAHPGTPMTLRNSIDFVPTQFFDKDKNKLSLMSDFFTGRGTNGWEFEPPQKTPDAFKAALDNTKPLRIALNNLAHFAGDPKGAFPPVQEPGIMHPYPALTMWGNFSNLRRALDTLDALGDYDKLSIADKTYIQTASCTVGMMAYEIDMVQRFDLAENDGSQDLWGLGEDLYSLMDGVAENGEVLPPNQLSRNRYAANLKETSGTRYRPSDYYDVSPDAYIAALRQKYIDEGSSASAVSNEPKLRLAEMIMLKNQIRRDRTFGFRPSPFFGHYAVDTRGGTLADSLSVFPTACDPDEFGFTVNAQGKPERSITNPAERLNALNADRDTQEIVKRRLALSRLCGTLEVPKSYDLSVPPNQKIPSALLVANLSRPVVMPKFPALHYLFPVQDHNLKGDLAANFNVVDASASLEIRDIPHLPGHYDTRQPSANLSETAPPVTDLAANAVQDMLLRKDPTHKDPYEPYVSDRKVQGIVKDFLFRRVQNEVNPVNLSSSRTPYFSNENADPAAAAQLKDPDFSTPKFALNVSNDPSGLPPLSFPTNLNGVRSTDIVARFPDKNRSPFPIAETAVNLVAIQPRQLNNFPVSGGGFTYEPWKLPFKTSADVKGTTGTSKMNIPTNIIEVPTKSGRFGIAQTPYSVPFLDRAIFDGRQLMLTRVMDMDLGLMRSDSISGGDLKEPLLPMSGIVYAFREDAVREDGIARPASISGKKYMSAINPANPVDPPIEIGGGLIGISTKPVDYLPDPGRRTHGFRLRNGAQIKRNKTFEAGEFTATDNYRGLSIFTDQPLYIQGDMNLHQTGDDDKAGTGLEEFRGTNALIRGASFSESKFYNRGTVGNGEKDPDFAQPDKDRWRPTELLADSISVLSDNFCDGSAADMFVNYDKADYSQGKQHPFSNSSGSGGEFDRGIYDDGANDFKDTGLYSSGCTTNNGKGRTSFRNSDQPFSNMPTVTSGRLDWLRENPNPSSYTESLRDGAKYDSLAAPAGDYMSPIKISRSGLPILRDPLSPTRLPACDSATGPKQACNPLPLTRIYGDSGDARTKDLKFRPIGNGNDNRESYPNAATKTNINSIVVSGIVPSQPGQSYGGLHNFPRFLEKWNNTILDYAGSFLQLSFSNYATAPFQMNGWEYDSSGTITPVVDATNTDDAKQGLQYYYPPDRQWGYDVALQLAAAGPAASRFVINTPSRNEFYTEPQINDPYILSLCTSAKTAKVKGWENLKCVK